jgi:hypothetical protein
MNVRERMKLPIERFGFDRLGIVAVTITSTHLVCPLIPITSTPNDRLKIIGAVF